MSMLSRRIAVGAILAVSATVASPLVGVAEAATFSGTIASTPATETSSSVTYVYANRPTLTATFSATLSPSSTIVVKDGTTPVTCPAVVSGATVSCQPSADLISTHTYNVTSHGVQASDGTAADATPLSFVDAHPTLSVAHPANGTTLAVVDGSSHQVNFSFTDPLRGGQIFGDSSKSYLEIYDSVGNLISSRNDDDFGPKPSSTSPPPTPLTPATYTTIVSRASLAPGAKYEAKLHVEGVDSSGADVPLAFDNEDVFFYVSDAAPTALVGPSSTVNAQTAAAIPFSGKGAPGAQITVSTTSGGQSDNKSVVVPSCSDTTAPVPSCPWSLTVNGSSTGSKKLGDGTATWTATTGDTNNPSGSGKSASGPTYQVDQTPPSGTPTVNASLAAGSTTMSLSATTTDTDIANWTVTVTDAGTAHTVGPQTFGATGGNALATQSIDVSSLDDGQLAVTVTPVDAAGNVGTSPAHSTVNKLASLKPNFNASTLVVRGVVVPLATAETTPIQSPTSISIVFGTPVISQWTDNSNSPPTTTGTTYKSSVCVTASAGSGTCLPGTLSIPGSDAGTTGDGRTMVFTFAGALVDNGSPYNVTVTAWSKNYCHDVAYGGPQGAPGATSVDPNCWQDYVGTIPVPATSPTQAFTFTVDNTKPVGTTVAMPTHIDASSFQTVGITGLAEPGTSVQLTVNSSGGGTFISNPAVSVPKVGSPQCPTADPQGRCAWSLVGNFSGLSDGTLTVRAVATDAAGNASDPAMPDTAPVLAARPSAPGALKAAVADSSVNLSWVAPTDNGGSAITGYVLTYQDTTAATDPVTATPAPNAAATSATVNDLTVGHTYLFTLCATNAATNGTDGKCHRSTVAATPAYTTSVTAKVSKALVTYGQSITLSGRLTRPDLDAGLTGKPVKIQPRYDNGSLGTAVTVTTDSTGNWKLTISKPAKNALYLVSFNSTGSDASYRPSNSSVRSLVAVVARIDNFTARSSSHTAPVTISGHVSPSQAGRYVYVYAKAAGASRFQRIGSARLSSTSTWSFTKAFGRGTFIVYVSFSSQNGNVGANSNAVKFTRS